MLFASHFRKASYLPAFAGMTLFLCLPLPAPAEAPALDPSFCRALTKHTPSADVAYQPNLDVHGKAVAPADLPGNATIELPEEITIPLTANLSQFLNLDQSAFPFNTMQRNDINLGTLTVRGEAVFFNGKPLTDAQQDNLAVLCMKPTEKP